MKILSYIQRVLPRSLKQWGLLVVLTLGSFVYARAQVLIGGNVYGGGDMGEVGGSASVQVISGNIGYDTNIKAGSVFAGARMADIKGSASVWIDGDTEGATDYILINRVYGGNDIAGHIGTSTTLPDNIDADDATADGVTTDWNAFVQITNAKKDNSEEDKKKIYIGQVYGGGNGEYSYDEPEVIDQQNGVYTHKIHKLVFDIDEGLRQNAFLVPEEEVIATVTTTTRSVKPDLAKTYVDIHGGSINYVYGGGNNATITEDVVICVNNNSNVVNGIFVDEDNKETDTETPENNLLTTARIRAMGVNTGFSYPTSADYQIGRMFGGNNSAGMDIRPKWNLEKGLVRNLYSGGNRGDMTNPEGLLVHIKPESDIVIDNLFGGCRMADVKPMINGQINDAAVLNDTYYNQNYTFPVGLSARLLIEGGEVHNVYGGNDVTGNVLGGNAIGIFTSISGDVYGGGNGSYPYTDNKRLLKDADFRDVFLDYYYDPGESSVQAMTDFRPDAEQVSIHLVGKKFDDKPTVIGGSLFLGGNSATIVSSGDDKLVQLKVGPHVIAENVFMGNNGENMVDITEGPTVDDNPVLHEIGKSGVLWALNQSYTSNKVKVPKENSEEVEYLSGKISSIDYTDIAEFAEYMEGAAMSMNPAAGERLVFDNDYQSYTAQIGSFYCGGNVGSMTYSGKQTMNFDTEVLFYNKIVGGCNNADVPKTKYNAAYQGGVLGSVDERKFVNGVEVIKYPENGKIKDRLELNFSNAKIFPKRWNESGDDLIPDTYKWDDIYSYTEATSEQLSALEVGDKYYTLSNGTYTECTFANANEFTEGTKYYLYRKTKEDFVPIGIGSSGETGDDHNRRLLNGNIYGGCYNSGHVNGNVVINIDGVIMDRYGDEFGLFADTKEVQDEEVIVNNNRRTGVILNDQAYDVNAVALAVFGAGKGEQTEIWGSSTVNLNSGYVVQVFGGGEQGYVGKGAIKMSSGDNPVAQYDNDGYYAKEFSFNKDYSTTINLDAVNPVYNATDAAGAEAEYLYGGGNEGDVCGNTYVYLGNGRIYDAFGGASDAKVLGHTEVYIGQNSQEQSRFPYVRNIVYGGNDFGGRIENEDETFSMWSHVSEFAQDKIYHKEGVNPADLGIMSPSTYVEYLQGRVDTIFGGSFGSYDYYDTDLYGFADDENETIREIPYQHSSFVNFRPNENSRNEVNVVFGGGTGYTHDRRGDASQDHSYVLIDIPDNIESFRNMQIYGAGAYNGLGMRETYAKTITQDLDEVTAIVDLIRGKVGVAYGASYNEGVTRRTMVNVPEGSTIDIGSIFGGAYGTDGLYPCDAYETHVNWSSSTALMQQKLAVNPVFKGAIYGGNNNARRTVFSQVNVNAKIATDVISPTYTGPSTGTVYGAGYGPTTWANYTEINLNPGAEVYEVYGGGDNGTVLNVQTTTYYMTDPDNKGFKALREQEYKPEIPADIESDPVKKAAWEANWTAKWDELWEASWKLGHGVITDYDTDPDATSLKNSLAKTAEIDERTQPVLKDKYNTNVRIYGAKDDKPAAKVNRYAYGGGNGANATVSGSTYIALLGGEVAYDLYAAGTSGSVEDLYTVKSFKASATAYIQGGSVRNVYGGGWKGSVGHADFQPNKDAEHQDAQQLPVIYPGPTDPQDDPKVYAQIPNFTKTDLGGVTKFTDILGETHVIIGHKKKGQTDNTYADGKPAIKRNVYGGGEGGSVYGTTYTTIYDGMIGYNYDGSNFNAQVDDKAGDGALERFAGSVFGGGYVANSSVDETVVTLYGGQVRSSVFGGGEIATVGRGTVKQDYSGYSYDGIYRITNGSNNEAKIYKAGHTQVNMYGGHVLKNVFGGGRGYDNWNGDGTYGKENSYIAQMDTLSKGYVFGQTEVNIYGGEIGTDAGVEKGYGNVFGGGDQGVIYSAYNIISNNSDVNDRVFIGMKKGERYDNDDEGYYYKHGAKTETKNGQTTTTFFPVYDDGTEQEPIPTYEVGNNEPILTIPPMILTEDCKVLVEPHTLVKEDVTIGGKEYLAGKYVPTSDLNKLKGKNDSGDASKWANLDQDGIIIHNAVFAGGNLKEGANKEFADAVTVYGNATATIHDAYNRDLITIGTGHTGGLYGDGNLTFVDGYRGLNITNYGTDYYQLSRQIDIDAYDVLPPREKAYYEPTFTPKQPITDKEGTSYNTNTSLPEDEIVVLFNEPYLLNGKPNPAYWNENGIKSIYAGRIMNTIQRADFCGVFGSRMVMKGARDRVSTQANYTNYTINRVREVSLNKVDSEAGDMEGEKVGYHGNYFGIYSVVNYLGGLTSDVDFKNTVRTTTSDYENTYPDLKPNGETFEEWKADHLNQRSRNNGNSHNQVALASGVYLELTTEESKGDGLNEKVWGLITGVIELDLINVQPGIGGGFVYAKNEHGKRTGPNTVSTLLPALNKTALSNRKWSYKTTDGDKEEYETTGNFIHSSQTILDDCYNISNKYKGDDAVPAHYWYIHGDIYIYDQYISVYSGSPSSYAETAETPISLSVLPNGSMTLIDVKPNRYAYWAPNGYGTEKLGDAGMVINNVKYNLNDPISWWDWNLLPKNEQWLFVEKTYVAAFDCTVGTGENAVQINAGDVYSPTDPEYNNLFAKSSMDITPNDGINNPVNVVDVDGEYEPFNFVFRLSNNLGHDTGYLLTYNMSNPDVWARNKENGVGPDETGPTYSLIDTDNMLLGQNWYDVGSLIPQSVETTYQQAITHAQGTGNQATFTTAYVTTQEIIGAHKGTSENYIEEHLNPGVPLALEEYSNANIFDSGEDGNIAEAYICTRSMQVLNEIIPLGKLMTLSDRNALVKRINDRIFDLSPTLNDQPLSKQDIADLDITTLNNSTNNYNIDPEGMSLLSLRESVIKNIQQAYYCITEGLYGGDYYITGKYYSALNAWSGMNATDRDYFKFNYDAFDLLIDPNYGTYTQNGQQKNQPEGKKYQYDSSDYQSNGTSAYPVPSSIEALNALTYSVEKPIDYTAIYNGNTTTDVQSYVDGEDVTHTGPFMKYNDGTTDRYVKVGDKLQREDFEKLPNEKRYYSPISLEIVELMDQDENEDPISYVPPRYIFKNTNGDGVTTGLTTTVYVVNTAFVHGETPYAVGTIISSDVYNDKLTEGEGGEQSYVTPLTFTLNDMKDANQNYQTSKTFYYCREGYTIGQKGEGKKVTGINITGVQHSGTYESGNVPQGIVIGADDYSSLPNRQLNFSIQGVAPRETSTLYVAANSDILDLTKEKIITVVYQYDYEESDATGLHITPVSERHVVNIHIKFESGIPYIGEIVAPEIVIPGNGILMDEPDVTAGAFLIYDSGWEIFENADDAEIHRNGVPFDPLTNKLYWYQDGYQLAYYAKTYLGKTYSNNVPLGVANYHDLKDVMDDRQHHLYVDYDRSKLQRDSKIYINDYSSNTSDGVELLKQLFDLSLLTSESDGVTEGVVTADGALKGHSLLNNSTERLVNKFDGNTYDKGVKGATNLEFIMRANINHQDPTDGQGNVTSTWAPIANDGVCFSGNLHGDGYTITGLSNSLFGSLCGNVYNLGVTGTFTGAGIADKGDGYIENCWISTTSTASKTTAPVFGAPSRTADQIAQLGEIQLVNSYYMENDDAKTTAASDNEQGQTTLKVAYENRSESSAVGAAIRKPAQSFYNGEVAFDLNGFYLNKRYYDGTTTKVPYNVTDMNYNSGNSNYLYIDPTIEVKSEWEAESNEYKARQLMIISYQGAEAQYGDVGYVEKRYADGDYRHSSGTAYIWTEKRERTIKEKVGGDTKESTVWVPIWPDDYIFFGQNLTFGYVNDRQHDANPTHYDDNNRVYRAPAYYGNSYMSSAYFNPDAVLADHEKNTKRDAFPGMTALDLTGNGDATYAKGETTTESELKVFYTPLLDFAGLNSFRNDGQTKNMLVYADYADDETDAVTTEEKTLDVLSSYLLDPEFRAYANTIVFQNNSESIEAIDDYRSVNKVPDEVVDKIHGHLVLKKTDGRYYAASDHFLVDKNVFNEPFDFNAPIAYTMGTRLTQINATENNVMWYQRTPDAFVQNAGKGWESISLPFTVKTVSTTQKGEVTHFYNDGNANSDKGEVGHEYWLRTPDKLVDNNAKVMFKSLSGGTGKVKNTTFLWNYYYNYNSRNDKNSDKYQNEFYRTETEFTGYPFAEAATPYLIGFPGKPYYEFDMSGQFEPKNTIADVSNLDDITAPAKLNKQTITFVSDNNGMVYIDESDKDYRTNITTVNSTTDNKKYYFKPIYQARVLDGGTTYLLNSKDTTITSTEYTAGTAFLNNALEANGTLTTVPFRAYFSSISDAGKAQTRGGTRAAAGQTGVNALLIGYSGSYDNLEELASEGGLLIYGKDMSICVESTLDYETQVTIYTVAGKLLKRFTIQPATKVTVPVNNRGVYIVNRHKIAVAK